MREGLIFFALFIPAIFLMAQQDGEEIPFGKYRVLHSNILNEDRTLLVSLPDDYESSIIAYPVLYLYKERILPGTTTSGIIKIKKGICCLHLGTNPERFR